MIVLELMAKNVLKLFITQLLLTIRVSIVIIPAGDFRILNGRRMLNIGEMPRLVFAFLRGTHPRNNLGVLGIFLNDLQLCGRFVKVLLLLLLLSPFLVGKRMLFFDQDGP
jgi:hypothetical protein